MLGAGIIGLCSALALLRGDPTARVVLLDRQEPCAGATGAGQGKPPLRCLNVCYCTSC